MIDEILEKENTIEDVTGYSSPAWYPLCNESDLVINSGVCALLPTHGPRVNSAPQQIAIFALKAPSNQAGDNDLDIYALTNFDPIGKANVMYRGIIGSINNEPMVASPLYKQHFSLITGKCFEQETVQLGVIKARLKDKKVEVLLPNQTNAQ